MSGIVSDLIEKIDNYVGRAMFSLEKLVCLFISWLQQLFNVFTGISQAKYDGKPKYLINVFFDNSIVNNIYWGMAIIGIVMAFVFAIISVTRKSMDLDDKMRQSHGQILRTLMRTIFIILTMSVFMTIIISFTNALMQSVNAVFNGAPTLLSGGKPIVYSDEQLAAMSRIFNTVGNYSLNQSANNRYNINTCYNDIRSDLQYLSNSGVFNYYYTDTDANGKQINTWQSAVQELAVAGDFNVEQPVDEYNESIANAMNHCMSVIKNDYNFKALESYDATYNYNASEVSLDRVLFLCGTMGIGGNAAARNEAYNEKPDMFDNVRAPYYMGQKDFYDLDTVNQDFYVSFSRMNYLLIYLAGAAIIVNMAIIIVNCIVRIFNLLFLYIIAPPVIAASPLDDGGKLKQWLTAFIVQAFSVFATVISMRIFLIFIPIVMKPNFQLVDNIVISTIGKLVMIWAGTVAIEKANGLLTGILADNAGWQSIMAGSTAQDVKGSMVGSLASKATSAIESLPLQAASFAGSKAWGITKAIGGGALSVASLPFKPITGAVSHGISRVGAAYGNLQDSLSNTLVESPEYKDKKAQAQDRQEQSELNRLQKQKLMQDMNPPPPQNQNKLGEGGNGGNNGSDGRTGSNGGSNGSGGGNNNLPGNQGAIGSGSGGEDYFSKPGAPSNGGDIGDYFSKPGAPSDGGDDGFSKPVSDSDAPPLPSSQGYLAGGENGGEVAKADGGEVGKADGNVKGGEGAPSKSGSSASTDPSDIAVNAFREVRRRNQQNVGSNLPESQSRQASRRSRMSEGSAARGQSRRSASAVSNNSNIAANASRSANASRPQSGNAGTGQVSSQSPAKSGAAGAGAATGSGAAQSSSVQQSGGEKSFTNDGSGGRDSVREQQRGGGVSSSQQSSRDSSQPKAGEVFYAQQLSELRNKGGSVQQTSQSGLAQSGRVSTQPQSGSTDRVSSTSTETRRSSSTVTQQNNTGLGSSMGGSANTGSPATTTTTFSGGSGSAGASGGVNSGNTSQSGSRRGSSAGTSAAPSGNNSRTRSSASGGRLPNQEDPSQANRGGSRNIAPPPDRDKK